MNASRSSPRFARPAARAAAVAAAVVLAAGSAAGQTIITTDTTINTVANYSSSTTPALLVGSSSPGPTLTIGPQAVITLNQSANASPQLETMSFLVGSTANPYATVVQNGGSVTSNGAGNSQLYVGGGAVAVYTGSASYTLNSGSITLGSTGVVGLLGIGRSSSASLFTQNGGTVNVTRNDTLLFMGTGGTGTYLITGGTFEGFGTTTGNAPGMQVGGSGTGTLTINGSGAVVAVQPANTVLTQSGGTATVNLNAGTLALNGNVTRGRPNSGSTPGTVSFTLGGGTLRPYDANLVVGSSTAANTAAFDITLAPSTTSTITGVGWKTGTHAVTIDSPLIGTGNIDFAGGTVTLSAANTYSGTTTISGGTLALGAGGSIADSSLIDVQFGANLNVASVTGGFSLASTKTLGGRGTLTGAATFADGSKLAFDATGPLIAANTLSFANFGIGSLADVPWDSLDLNSPYTLIDGAQDFASASLLDFGESSKTSVGTNRQAYFQAPGDGTNLQLVVVPEPAGLALAGLGVAAAAWALRRRAAAR